MTLKSLIPKEKRAQIREALRRRDRSLLNKRKSSEIPPYEKEKLNRALLEAVFNDNYEAVEKALASGADPNTRGRKEMTPLLYSSIKGNENIAKILLDFGADPNATNDEGTTPLMGAAACGASGILWMLIQKRVPVNIRRHCDGMSALIWAARNNHYESAELLLHAGADPNIRRNDGLTALSRAKREGHERIIALLHAHNAIE